MTFVDWDDSFELGIKELDEHHKHLVDLMNETFLIRSHGPNSTALRAILDKLVDYSLYHFAAEEDWMRRQKYPDLCLHREEHKSLARTILGHRDNFFAEERGVASVLLVFLKDKLMNHILYEDFKFKKIAAGFRI
jgi:hemerythrin